MYESVLMSECEVSYLTWLLVCSQTRPCVAIATLIFRASWLNSSGNPGTIDSSLSGSNNVFISSISASHNWNVNYFMSYSLLSWLRSDSQLNDWDVIRLTTSTWMVTAQFTIMKNEPQPFIRQRSAIEAQPRRGDNFMTRDIDNVIDKTWPAWLNTLQIEVSPDLG